MECRRVCLAMYQVTNEPEDELVASFRDHLGRCPVCAHYFAYISKLLALVRGRCNRYCAPSALRIRILSSLPHRGGRLDLE